MNRIHPKPWDKSKPVGKFASISQAARELRMTRQEVKAMFRHVDQFETDQTARASTQPAVTVAMEGL